MTKDLETKIKTLIEELDELKSKDSRQLIFLILKLCQRAQRQSPDFTFKLEITCDGCLQRTNENCGWEYHFASGKGNIFCSGDLTKHNKHEKGTQTDK